MKKIIWACVVALVLGVVLFPMMGNAHMGRGYGPGYGPGYCMGPGMMGPGYGYGYGMMGRMMGPGYGMGPGMMGGMMGRGMMGPGYGMGPGMMGPGYGYGGQYGPQYGPQYQQPHKPLDQEQAKQEVENYLSAGRNPNLKLGQIEEKGNDYVVDIETKDGSLVDKILVNKYTGWMRSMY